MYVLPHDIKRISPNVLRVDYNLHSMDKVGLLITSDHHFDNPKCNRDLLKADHEEAVRRKAMICAFGDIYCAMQGKGDFRGSKSDIRPENMTSDYLGSLIREGQKFYGKYADNYLMMSPGNHETGVKKHREVDLITALVSGINATKQSDIHAMPYNGWIFLRLLKPGGGRIRTIKISYHHGYGGGGPVTRDVIQTNRKAVYLPDADFVISGHTHDKWEVPIIRERISDHGYRKFDQQVHIKIPTYKEEYMSGKGFHIEKGRGPKPLGAAFLELQVRSQKDIWEIRHNIEWTWNPTMVKI